ncbi:MAG: hypothetical protein PHU95_02295 [Candidatus Thermoplasmatota archaeon]|nr:hypothetical protein [Candidatus Thermoplasmatota archaeon]MDD5778262.1 hypothetical protein [Candidatus Thermoplasmatota archaeon]
MLKEIDIEWIRSKIAELYDGKKDGYSTTRELHVHKSYCNYDTLGCVFFALNGSPPKGYAIYVPDHYYVVIVDCMGKCRRYRDVVLTGLEELKSGVVKADLKNQME